MQIGPNIIQELQLPTVNCKFCIENTMKITEHGGTFQYEFQILVQILLENKCSKFSSFGSLQFFSDELSDNNLSYLWDFQAASKHCAIFNVLTIAY